MILPADEPGEGCTACELLVGSDTARMDPEDLRDVVQAFRRCVETTAGRHHGHAASAIGYTILVYFGFPVAHEHDAEEAVRAGLELLAAVAALASPFPLQARVAIATGLVVTGDLIESGEAPERGIVGETPNLAALDLIEAKALLRVLTV